VAAAHERDEHMLDQYLVADDRSRHFAFERRERLPRPLDACSMSSTDSEVGIVVISPFQREKIVPVCL